MCSIIGLVSEKNTADDAKRLFEALQHRGPDGCGFVSENAQGSAKRAQDLQIPDSKVLLGHCLLSTTGFASQPVSKNDLSISHNGQLYNYEEFGDAKNFTSDSKVLCDFLEKEIKKGGLEYAAKELLKNSIGEFALAGLYRNKMFALRDFTGQKPVWFGQNNTLFAIASESLALKKIGIDPMPLEPGHLLTLGKSGFSIAKIFDYSDFAAKTPKKGSQENLAKEFGRAIELQTRNVKNAAVLFSGGVDSSLVAASVMQKTKAKLFVAGMKNSHDLVSAQKASGDMGWDLVRIELSEKDVHDLAVQATERLGFFDSMQVSIAVPELACAKAIAQEKLKVVFSGQGSDEIFCGYSSYSDALREKGYAGVETALWDALLRMWKRNFHRDDAMVSGCGLELRLPFFAQNFLKEAMAIPARSKILSAEDTLRKHPVRKLAAKYNIPEYIAKKPKKALQYGSGVQKVVSRLFN